MNRRQLLRTVAAFACVGVTIDRSSRILAGAFSVPASAGEDSLLTALLRTQTHCLKLFAELPLTSHTAPGLTPAVEELQCLTEQAILICRAERAQSPAIFQASSDSIDRVCRILRQAELQHDTSGGTLSEMLSSLQRTSVLLKHAIVAGVVTNG